MIDALKANQLNQIDSKNKRVKTIQTNQEILIVSSLSGCLSFPTTTVQEDHESAA